MKQEKQYLPIIQNHNLIAQNHTGVSIQPPPLQLKSEPKPLQVPWNDTILNDYTDVENYDFGANRAGNKELDRVDYIVLHSTGGSNLIHSLNAHLEVDKDGIIYNANNLEEQNWHAGHKWQNQKNHTLNQYKNINTRSLGIEFVNDYITLETRPKNSDDDEGMTKLRNEIKVLNLAPNFKQELMNLSNKDLLNKMKNNSYVIYTDINHLQKKAAYELQQNMLQDYPKAQFVAHEHIAPKKLGEGENTLEFLNTINLYNINLKKLQTLNPYFWNQVDAQKKLLSEKAEKLMSAEAFYQEFYGISQRAIRLINLINDAPNMTTKDLIHHLRPDSKESTGMYRMLGDYKNHTIRQYLLNNREFYIDINITNSTDWSAEDIKVVINGQESECIHLNNGESHTFSFPLHLIKNTLDFDSKAKTQILIKEIDPFFNDTLYNFEWSPLVNIEGLSFRNSKNNVKIYL